MTEIPLDLSKEMSSEMVTSHDREDMRRLTEWEDSLEERWSALEELFNATMGQEDRNSSHLHEAQYNLDLAVIILNRLLSSVRQGECHALTQESRSRMHELLWRLWALTYDASERTRRVREAILPPNEEPLDAQSDLEQRRRHEQFWMAPHFHSLRDLRR